MNQITIYGIPNCDSTKKALDLMKKKQISFVFHDYKKEGISKAKLKSWSKELGWETLLNKRGTTWRNLDKALQESIGTESAAINLMAEHNSLIKRPVIETGKTTLIGFDEKIISSFKK